MKITSKVRHCWLLQLQAEYKHICQMHRLSLKLPVFEITSGSAELGRWSSATRTLGVSQNLILKYPWAITIQVLKHEMAHQLSDEFFRASGGHDHNFEKSCELLGVLPQFRKCKILLSQSLEAFVCCSSDRIGISRYLLKVEKLLALGKSSNSHEAELALQKANELMVKYNLEQLCSDQPEDHLFHIIDEKRRQISTCKRFICLILQEFFFVQVVLSKMYDPRESEEFRVIELYGTKQNLVVAEYCYYFLIDAVARLWDANKAQFGKDKRRMKKSYQVGVVQGFYQKLKKDGGYKTTQSATLEGEERGLIKAEDVRLKKFVKMVHPKTSKRSIRAGKMFTGSYRKGFEAGKDLKFHDGLNGAAQAESLFLE